MTDASTRSADELAGGAVWRDTTLLHKYLPPVPVRVTAELGGTEDERIYIMRLQVGAPCLVVGIPCICLC